MLPKATKRQCSVRPYLRFAFGGFLIDAAKYCKINYGNQKAIRLYGQEDVWNTWAISNINMILHGLDAKIEKGDTILDPKFKEEDNELEIKKFDTVNDG